MKNKQKRRDFIRTGMVAGAGLSFGFSAKSYASIIGANDRVNFAVAGLNSRGNAHVSAVLAMGDTARLVALCDVDSRVFEKVNENFKDRLDRKVKTYEDVRVLLEDTSIDALTVAAPDHWHTPMAIMAMNAGKHVFLEKPCCHNPQEGEWLVQAEQKTKRKLQIGNQQRSAPTSQEIVKEIHNGVIGQAHSAKAWYANTREGIGKGKEAPVPSWLNWELWQGPAPRTPYRDNVVHYNWHWFWRWGTGEINNNGLHEMDICRWALKVDIPDLVVSSGGRYHFDDDWEFYDTQVASFQFGDKMITWEGRSCNGLPVHNRSRGAAIYGDEGSVIIDRNGYELYDAKGALIKEVKEVDQNAISSQDLLGMGGLDNYHMLNFIQAIQKDEPLNSPAGEGIKTNLMCHLGNMSQKWQSELEIDSSTGEPKHQEAMKMWSRDYQEGWKPAV